MAPRRSLKVRALLWIVAFAVICGILAGAVAVFAPKGRSTQAGSAPVPSGQPSPAASGGPTLLADGCLGGSDPSQAILVAQAQAPLTPEGAAAFAATYERWGTEIPHKGAIAPVGARVWTSDLTPSLRHVGEWPASLAGATGWASMTGTSRYRVDAFDGRSATVSILYETYVVPAGGGQASPGGLLVQDKLEVVNGHWRIAGSGTSPTADEMKSTGIPFKAGC
jgi:hypothetical protein